MGELPTEVQEYKRTRAFNFETTPAGLTSSHRLRPNVWGEIVVTHGCVTFVLEDAGNRHVTLTPERPGVVEPERPHHVVPDAEARFFVRFLRAPEEAESER